MGALGTKIPALSILLIDDEPGIRKTLGIALRAEGHQVTAVSNAKEALIEAGRRYFDLALVDLRLGTESGMDLISRFQTLCPLDEKHRHYRLRLDRQRR